jgi:hypothetical protein
VKESESSNVPKMWEMRRVVIKRMVRRDFGIEEILVNWG